MALTGHVDEISRSRIEGWACDPERPGERISVSIFVNGIHRGSGLANLERPDLAREAGRELPADCAFLFAFDPPLSGFVELRVEVLETWSGEQLRNGARTLPCPAKGGDTVGLRPILVTSTGRAGTTMLMSEFARHPDIIVGDRYPYEIKQIAYHAAAFRALVADANRERSTVPDTMLAPEMCHMIGGNPYNMAGLFDLGTSGERLRQFYHSSVPAGYATLYRTLIQEFYLTLAEGQGKQAARSFCEKGDIDEAAIQGARLFFDTVKEIVIVRDPRDLLCSAIAFWKLSPEQALRMLRSTFPRLVHVARHAGPDTITVRYEDLIRDPVTIRRALSDFLDVDLLRVPTTGDAVANSHRTSSDSSASIGRWRNDLTPQQIEECEQAFGPSMRDFDYEPSDLAADRTRSFAHRRLAAENQIVAAEGAAAVAGFLDDTDLEGGAGSRRPILELSFGRQGSGRAFATEGWSSEEQDFFWSCTRESELLLPAIRRGGEYELRIVAEPFTHGTVLPAQRITILVDGQEVGSARIRDICVLAIVIPSTSVRSGQNIKITFGFPDAARPSEVCATPDDRLLGFWLHRLTLSRIDHRHEVEAQSLGPPLLYVGAPVETPPTLTGQWRLGAAE